MLKIANKLTYGKYLSTENDIYERNLLYLYYSSIFHKEFIEPLIPALQQMKEGLNVNGLLDEIQANPNAFKVMFVKSNEELTIESFNSLFKMSFSEQGSNKRQSETNVSKFLEDFIETCFHDGKFEKNYDVIFQTEWQESRNFWKFGGYFQWYIMSLCTLFLGLPKFLMD